MRPQDVIRKKRDGGALSREEIAFFVRGVARREWEPYQASALLMAIFLRGLDQTEGLALVEEMRDSGTVLDLSHIGRPKVDKHSTGGVGDKTSLILAPVVAAAGGCVPMISGRGLGHSGGTLDKLESIPGFRVNLSIDEFIAIAERVGYAMAGQTDHLAPADRTLYALRDATATVESIPLIVASILSKKLAAGLDALVLDVKFGTGAFMREEEQARALARALIAAGRAAGLAIEALLTDMNQPLGRAAGNAIEVQECLAILRGAVDEKTRPVRDLSLALAARMISLAGIERDQTAARALAARALDSGAALEKFRLSVEAQGGDPRVCDDPARLMPGGICTLEVKAPRAGYVARIEATEIGLAIVEMGGGRTRVEDRIDPAVGFSAEAHIGDEVRAGDALGVVYCRDEAQGQQAAARIRAAYQISDSAVARPPLIKEVIVG
jgi:pyrimidine-nucleoside phosphorylase